MTEVAQSFKVSLPKKSLPALVKNPKSMIIYSHPKAGKTTSISKLENCLLIDLENGSDYVECLKIKANNLEELTAICAAIKDENYPYKYVAIDTITKLEEWMNEPAMRMYKNTPMGRNHMGTNILELPNGAGYLYLRQAFQKWIEALMRLAPQVIFIGHLKDKLLQTKSGTEVSAKDIDLIGKNKSITCAAVDAVGYLYREDDKVYLNFKSSEDVVCGARSEHLAGKVINITDDWKNVYID